MLDEIVLQAERRNSGVGGNQTGGRLDPAACHQTHTGHAGDGGARRGQIAGEGESIVAKLFVIRL